MGAGREAGRVIVTARKGARTPLRLLPCEGTYFQCVSYADLRGPERDLGEADFCTWLTRELGVAAIPVAGRYRAIDFQVSNLVNSGVRNVGVITQKNYHSLMDHLGSGKEWDLHRKREGLFVLPPFMTKENTGLYRGSVDAPIRNSSTARAHWRPSRMAHTTSDWPRRMSPAAKTLLTLVR